MSQIIWNAEHGWHETDDEYRLVMTPSGAIRWVKTDENEEKES
tara:strand:+ start:504 stop:632 length:129 start_codon:yes stop_codon:yes gene_type:complete